MPKRKRIRFTGIVQGVGFRPTVYRCAVELGLTGTVQNRRSEVIAEIQGENGQIERFEPLLLKKLPAAARLDTFEQEDIEPVEEETFEIIPSKTSDYVFPPIPPDLAVCEECKKELFDPNNRRYLYPFITCTQCGPRYSIVEDTPFDRDTTSMIDFPQCPDCLEEYTSPEDRRFHSQTNSCSVCGPSLTLLPAALSAADTAEKPDNGSSAARDDDPVKAAVRALSEGKVVAIHGIGGFHLAVDPSSKDGLAKLRRDKERERKPFALMVRDVEEAARLCVMGAEEHVMLTSPENPIVIMPMRSDLPVRETEYLNQVSDIGTLGVMVPYTPLHLLLFYHPEITVPYSHLIMTSGNLKGEPIITDPTSAREKLAGAADLILTHNRRILFRTDDSVVRMTSATGVKKDQAETTRPHGQCLIRRSRGYVPHILKLKEPADTVTLALGGDLKSAPAFASGSDVYLAPYIGDLEGAEIITAFEEQIDKILDLYGIEPKRLVHDLHPGYVSTQWAADLPKHRSGISRSIEETIGVQHHHAHILSVMAEHGLDEVLGLSFDGTGYGTDGTIWGGEFLFAGRSRFTRLGRFAPFLLPGGDAAVRNPPRTAFAILTETGVQPDTAPAAETDEPEKRSGLYEIIEAVEASGLTGEERSLVPEMVKKRINSPVTSSLGRIFDAAAAVLGLVDVVGYEGEGPMKLEGSACRAAMAGRLGSLRPERAEELLPLEERSGLFEIDPGPLLWYLAEEMKQTEQKRARIEELAALFHQTIAYGALNGALTMRDKTGIEDIALSGGVFQNIYLLELVIPLLEESGFNVYTNSKLPPGDGGIAVGQAYYKTG